MRAAGQADSFVIINGPEDGTEFPVVRAPFHIGSESACPVQIRLDMNVDDLHALVTVVSDGYRVRRTSRNPVFVNGKRTGSLLSRIAAGPFRRRVAPRPARYGTCSRGYTNLSAAY